jgi:hypothetical protein
VSIDASVASPPLDDKDLATLIRPLAYNVVRLTLARSLVTDATGETLRGLENLDSLDLSRTAVSAAIVSALTKLPRLERLNLSESRMRSDGVSSLTSLAVLRNVVLWSTEVDSAAVDALRASRPTLDVEWGDRLVTSILDVEKDIKLSSDRPLPVVGGKSTANAPISVLPINTKCPVSDQAVNPSIVVLFEGKPVGFCCAQCPTKFWSDPESYRKKIP